MKTARHTHSCALVKNVLSGSAEIVAVGGFSSKGSVYLNSIEIFSVDSLKWRKAGNVSVSLFLSLNFHC
jgi:hypothetical protein